MRIISVSLSFHFFDISSFITIPTSRNSQLYIGNNAIIVVNSSYTSHHGHMIST